ncbi:MAG: O-antigen ligase family protein [Steroidobacteraceae bacterium]
MTTTSVSDTTWRLGAAAIVLSFALDPLGNAPSAAGLAVVSVAALQVFLARRVDDTANVVLLALAAIIVVIATLEIFHRNVPSLTVGLLGFRKSATFVLGIAIGLGWRGSRLHGLRLTWWCMFAAASVSLVVHLMFPAIERAIPRSADKYTALLGGIERMQGLMAGPFHVSMVGVFLFLSALAPGVVIRSRWVRGTAAVVGLSCVYFAQVRTGLVALAVGAVAMMLVTGSARRWVNRLILLTGLGILCVIYLNPLTEYARRFTALRRLLDAGQQDTRITARFTAWSTSLEMINDSPFFGSGSGSAGDTLGQYFAAGDRVTSHNTFLKYAVEGGIFQGLLFAALCIGLALAVRPRRDSTRFGVAAGMTFLIFALVSAAPEALPISLGLAVTIGLCAQPTVDRSVQAVAESGGRHCEGEPRGQEIAKISGRFRDSSRLRAVHDVAAEP